MMSVAVSDAAMAPDQNLFLRRRISAKTSSALLPASPTDAATEGTSARRKQLVFFSAPMVEGNVGLPAVRNASASLARAFRSGLSGSIVRANLILASVYSCPQ